MAAVVAALVVVVTLREALTHGAHGSTSRLILEHDDGAQRKRSGSGDLGVVWGLGA